MKNNLELRKINTNDIEAQWAYTTELPTDENGLTNPYNGVSFDEYKNKVLPTLISYEHPVNMPDWFVPEEEIYLRVNKNYIASQKVMINNSAYRVSEDEEHYFMRIPKQPVKQLVLINDDYLGHVDYMRHASRGILLKDDKVLLSYESNNNKYIIPGGGVEENETYAECCSREMLEETGMKVKVIKGFLDIEELFDAWRHINHYFICELIEDTGIQKLTEAERNAGYTYVWKTLREALEIFGKYENYHDTNIADYGLYRREFLALSEVMKIAHKKYIG